MADNFERAVSVWKQLTWQRLMLGAVGALVVIVSAYSWEHRDTVVPALIGNSIAIVGVAVSIACIAVGLVGNALLERMDRKGDQLDNYLQRQLEDLRKEMKELSTNEAICQRRLLRAEREIYKLGGSFPNSDMGAL